MVWKMDGVSLTSFSPMEFFFSVLSFSFCFVSFLSFSLLFSSFLFSFLTIEGFTKFILIAHAWAGRLIIPLCEVYRKSAVVMLEAGLFGFSSLKKQREKETRKGRGGGPGKAKQGSAGFTL